MINIENLSYTYPGTKKLVLADIRLDIAKGSLFGLIGPNGAGKTTLISLLTGLLKLSQGKIVIDGLELPKSIKRVKQLVGYVPQDYAFYEELTALENLQFFAGVQGVKGVLQHNRIKFCLDFCQLQDVATQRVKTFSGGMKRRLNIAIGLLTDPDIIIFDEPTVGIDPQSRAFILAQIKTLQQQGKTIIYTSHYMEEVEQLCDTVALIDHGCLLVQGSVDDLQKNKQLVIDCQEDIDEQTLQQLACGFEVQYKNKQLVFDEFNSMENYYQVIGQVEKLNVKINAITFGKANLENLFLALTNKQLRDH
jgi:ABC-2 type transport system ATP-binding protein